MYNTGAYVLVLLVASTSAQEQSTTEYFTVVGTDTVPSKPKNVTVLGVHSNSMKLRWLKPKPDRGAIEGYRVYYMFGNYTDVQNLKLSNGGLIIKYNLTDLKPNTEYKIWVKAFTAKNEGESSDAIFNKTDVGGPSAPRIVNLTCQSEESIYIKWERPREYYNTIDFYFINYTDDFSDYTKMIETTAEQLDIATTLENLTTNTLYEVRVTGATRSLFVPDKVMLGDSSEMKKIMLKPNCEKILTMRQSTEDVNAGMIAGVVCAAFVFVFSLSAFILYKKCFHSAYYYLDDPPPVPTTSLEWNVAPEGHANRGAIPVHLFVKHVAELHVDGDIGFSKEYELIQAESSQDEYVSEHSQHPENRVKNRYLNIIAYDHTRVQLLAIPGQKKCLDYVNANYIDGFQCTRAYIGTQGPLPSTFDCFWRMVWEQRVAIIVMITNLVERGRDSLILQEHCNLEAEHYERKCDMYWPKDGIETFGIIQVRLVKEDVMATYTVRTLQIRHLKIKKKKAAMAEKTVYQYHYTSWPDHGTPDHALPVLHFIKKSSAANPAGAGPIIVHCSAGVGRTGTYIVIDAMLKQIQTLGEINIYGFLHHIRTQRNFLVQTEEQYIFIHDALVEAIESGETNICKDQIPKYVQDLQTDSIEERTAPWKLLDTQFKLVTSFECKDFHLVSASKAINLTKNRNDDYLPVETSRVHLTPKPGEEGSDYINATWLQGFNSLREFIITQHPLASTVSDFWQMVWDHNSQTIVMLGIIDNQEFEVYWPLDHNFVVADTYRMRLLGEQVHSTYILREFNMQSTQDDYELHVRMIQCSDWPNSTSSMYLLPNLVQEYHPGYQNGPIIVVDRYGGTEAASFCLLTTLRKHLKYDNHADIYMYAKLYHSKRPGIWRNCDDYMRLHVALQTICGPLEGAPDLYTMANGGVAMNGSLSNDSVRVTIESGTTSVSHHRTQ